MATTIRHFSAPDHHFFLFGPRGTGKSTWLKARYPQAEWFDLLDPELLRELAAYPERLADRLARSTCDTVVIDEVQKVPALLDVVHREIESKRKRRFVLTGSSSRKLKQTGVNLLAGRVLLRAMHPFMASELGSDFDLDRSLRQGLLPLVYDSPEPEQTLKAYVALYLKEEVQNEGVVRHVGNFARFLEALSLSHGSVWNTSGVARECQVSRKTVEGYMEIFEDLLLGFRVPVLQKRAKRHMSMHPKFYWFDAGVYQSARPRGPLDRGSETAGAALEGLVAQHLRAWVDYSNQDAALYFWRTRAGNEVDFVVYGEDTFLALEVKHADKVHTKDLRGLKTFLEDYPEAEARLLYRGKHALKIDGILCTPVEQYLAQIVPNEALP